MAVEEPRGRPSVEALRALADARNHRVSTEAVLPVMERIRDGLREALDGNHFVELLQDTLREAARR